MKKHPKKEKISDRKMFVVRKYVMAKDAAEAIRIEKKCGAHDVWVDEKWADANKGTMGFSCDA